MLTKRYLNWIVMRRFLFQMYLGILIQKERPKLSDVTDASALVEAKSDEQRK